MNRLLSLGFLVFPVAALSAADPVSVYPTVPGGSLSQPLTSIVNGSAGTVPAQPAMVSQPAWGTPSYCPPASCAPPTRLAPRPLITPRVRSYSAACETGYGSRGGLLARLWAWLCGGSGPAHNPGIVFAPPVAPPQAWTPGWGHAVGGDSPAGWPSKCEANGGRCFPMGRLAGGATCQTDGSVPVAAGPRPIHIPLPSAYDSLAGTGSTRPGLLSRMVGMLTVEPTSRGFDSAPSPLFGAAPPAQAQPVPGGTGVTGGYHFATTESAVPAVSRTAATQPVSSVPTATKAFTTQR